MRHRLLSFLRAAARRRSFERDMDEELRFHLEARTADLVSRGYTPADAARRARLEFGHGETPKDAARAGLGLRLLDEMGGDLRYALRTFARNKGFAFAAVATLALGIGANTAIFNLIDALLLRALPVSRPDQLLQVMKIGADATPDESFSYPMVRALDARQDLFAGVAGFSPARFTVGSGASMQRVRGGYVSGAFYETLGLTPAAGRLLMRADDVKGAPIVAVASFDYWRREFGGDPAIVGRTLSIYGVPVEIVGVTPRGFVGANVGTVADLTVPIAALPSFVPQMATLLGPGNSWLRVLARLRPGISPSEATARLGAEWAQIAEQSIDPGWSITRKNSIVQVQPALVPGGTGWSYLREIYVKPLQVLMGVVALVLAIACANVASLLMARATARRREFAVRLAIGASRPRLVRQLLIESVTLSLAGAAAAIVLGRVAGTLIVDIISTPGNPLMFDLSPGWRVLAFTSAVAIATAIIFGVVPALQATSTGPAQVLTDHTRASTSRSRLLPSLVTAQMALSLVLLIGAALFIQTLRNLQRLDPGFRYDAVLVAGLEQRPGMVPDSVVERVRRLPGVIAASISTHTPLSGATWSEPALPAGQPLPERDTAVFVGASPGFFATLQVPIVAGRDFTNQDSRQAPAVAIVNERYAQRYFENQNPIGRRLDAIVRGEKRQLEIVGVAGSASTASLRALPPMTVYVPYAQLTGDVPTNLELRTSGSIPGLMAQLKEILQPLQPAAPVDIEPLSAQVQGTLVQERMMATLGAGFGLLALALASVGIYGLLAYSVARRTREIGIRMALGAHRRGVMALVLGAALRPLAVGIAIGLPAAWAASRWIDSMLFGLKPTDPATIAVATIVLALVAHLAAYLPARRAARVDPLIALKCE
jgi:predicted permease